MKLKILLETPVIALPMCTDSNQLIIAHLGTIIINNGADYGETVIKKNAKIENYFKSCFCIDMCKSHYCMNIYSMIDSSRCAVSLMIIILLSL